MREEEEIMAGQVQGQRESQPQVTAGEEEETDLLLNPYNNAEDDPEVIVVHLGNEPGGDETDGRSSRRHWKDPLPLQMGLEPRASSGMEDLLTTIQTLKDLITEERILRRCYGQTPDPIYRAFIELLEALEEEAKESSVPVIKDLELKKKKKMLTSQWSLLPPIESNHLRSILFVFLTQIGRAASTAWPGEDVPKEDGPVIKQHIQEIIQTFIPLLNTTRSDMEDVLYLQRDIANCIWKMNHLYKVSKRRGGDKDLNASLDLLVLDLMQLANSLVSTVVEHWIVLWPTLEYYAQGSTMPSAGDSETSTQRSSGLLARIPVETKVNIEDSEPILKSYARQFKGLQVLKVALMEMESEAQEWGDVTPSKVRKSVHKCSGTTELGTVDGNGTDQLAGGDASAEGTPEEEPGESVEDLLNEAYYITWCILSNTHLGVSRLQHRSDGRSCSMFLIEYLDEEKFKGKVTSNRMRDINALISLNYTLFSLKLSVEEITEKSAGLGRTDRFGFYAIPESEDDDVFYFQGGIRDMGLIDLLIGDRLGLGGLVRKGGRPGMRTFKDGDVTGGEDGLRDISFVNQRGGGLVRKGGRPGMRFFKYGDVTGGEDDVVGRDGDVIGRVSDKMLMFRRKLINKLAFITDREGFRDERLKVEGGKWLRLENMWKAAWSLSESRREFWQRVMQDVQGFEGRLRDAYGPGSAGRGPFPIDSLLYDSEKEALREMSHSRDLSILENLDRVTQAINSNKGEGAYGRKYLRGFPRPPEDGKLPPLEEAAVSLRKSNIPREKLKARAIDVFLLMIFPVLYLADVGSDAYMACRHFLMSNYLYFALTILFVLGPMVAEVISKFAVKLKGCEDDLPWKDVFCIEILRLMPRAVKSLRYALNSRKEFDRDLTTFYSVLNKLRGSKVYGWSETLPVPNNLTLSRRHSTWGPGFDARLIQAHSYAMMITNEKILFHWKMVDCLNESAPQLLLQLVILNVQLVGGERVGHWSILGIVVSLACFSWTLHLCHYYMHYDGLKNNFKIADRLTDFLAHFLIVGGRFAAISFVAALYPIYFIGICILYLTGRCIYLYNFSSSRWAYKLITKNYLTVLWPVHRLFITPYILRIWRCDVFDDVIYHVETFVLALSWAYLLDGDHPLGHLRWAVTAAILIANFVLLPLILKYNNARHEPSRFCKEDDPFWLGKYLGRKLEMDENRKSKEAGKVS